MRMTPPAEFHLESCDVRSLYVEPNTFRCGMPLREYLGVEEPNAVGLCSLHKRGSTNIFHAPCQWDIARLIDLSLNLKE